MGTVVLGQSIPPDRYGDEHHGSDVLRRNDGQVMGTDGHPRPDIVASFEGSPIGIHVRDSSRVSFTYTSLHNDSITADTAYRVDMSLGATKLTAPDLLVPAPGVANYYRGETAVEQVPAFYRAMYPDILEGIDFHVYGTSSGPRMAFVVQPGGDPYNIKLLFNGQDSLGIDWQGALKIYMEGKWIELRQAIAYQVQGDGSMTDVGWNAQYELDGGNAYVHFSFGDYDPSLPLVLQIGYGPMGMGGNDMRNLDWSTYIGGSGGDELTSVETDENGDPYYCGHTWSPDFPVQPGNSLFPPFIGTSAGWSDAVILKVQASNKQMAWATYYGGGTASDGGANGKTVAHKLKVYRGPSSELDYTFVTGTTNCTDFNHLAKPNTVFSNAEDEAFNGGQNRMWVGAFQKLNGIRDWATTHGENETNTWNEEGLAIAVGPNGELAVGGRDWGYSASPAFQSVTPSGSYNQAQGGGFVMLFNPDFTIKWSTAFGAEVSSTPPYTQITDLCFTRSNSSTKLWLTGASENFNGGSIHLDYTPPPNSSGFYHDSGMAFLASFDVPSLQLDYCTGWGGEGLNVGYGLDFDGKHLWMVGGTESQALTDEDCPDPGGIGVHHTHVNSGSAPLHKSDGFILAFDPENFSLDYGTLLGGANYDMLLDVTHDFDNVYITGETRSTSTFGTDLDPNRYYQPLNANQNHRDAIILGISNDVTSPTLFWNTAFGGTQSDRGWGIAASPSEAFLAGTTASNPWELFPLKEFDPSGPDDFYQEYNLGGLEYSFLEFYQFEFGLIYEHYTFGEGEGEALHQNHDGFMASFMAPTAVGVHELTSENTPLTISPIPVPGEWSVQLPTMDDWTIRAMDATGRAIGHWKTSNRQFILDLREQPSGMYLIGAFNPAGVLLGAKVVRP